MYLIKDETGYCILLVGLFDICILTFLIMEKNIIKTDNLLNFKLFLIINILDIFMELKVNYVLFISSMVLSFPKFSLRKLNNLSEIKLRSQDIKCLIYNIISTIVNLIAIKIGIDYKVLSMVSDGILAICNSCAIYFSIIASVYSEYEPTKHFSYGYKPSIYICNFAVTIFISYVSIDLLVTSIKSLIVKNKSNQNDSYITLYISIIGLLVNLIGFILIKEPGDENKSDGNILAITSDTLSGVAIIINNYLRIYHHIMFVDPFISGACSLMILILSLSKIKELISYLNLEIPENISKGFLNKLPNNLVINNNHIWKLDEKTYIFNSSILQTQDEVSFKNTFEMIQKSIVSENDEQNNNQYTIEII